MVNVSDVDVIALASDRYSGSHLDAHDSHGCRVTHGDQSSIWARWRIAIGPGQGVVKDGYEVVASFKDDLDQPTIYTYSHSIGISVTEGTTTKLTKELSNEMSINFKLGPVEVGAKASVKHAREWSNSKANTWSESTKIEAEVKVSPGKKVYVKQLQGKYGPLTVQSNHIKVDYM